MEIYLIFAVLLLLIVLLMQNRMPTALPFVGAVGVFLFLDMIEPQALLACYANETLITLLLLLQVSGVVEKTSFIPQLTRQLFEGGSMRKALLKLSLFSLAFSSHLNNTAVVAALMGTVKTNRYFAPSKLLMPLSYAAIMGGVLTLIGTSTNLIVNSFVVKAGLPAIKFYDFIYLGAPLALLGIAYLIFVMPRLLPNHGLEQDNGNGDYFLEATVGHDSKLVGRTVHTNGLRSMEYLFLAEIIRQDHLISPVTPEEYIQPGDTLVFTGDIQQIQELRKFDGLELHDHSGELLKSNLQEVVIKHNAPVIGRRIKDAQFRTKFDAAVVAVRRGEERLSGKIGQMVLNPGDSLVLATGKEFKKHENLRRNFIPISPIEAHGMLSPGESWVAVSLFVGGIGVAALGILSLFKVMVALMFIFLALGYLPLKHLKTNLDLSLLLMIGSSLGLSQVLSHYGVADLLAQGIIGMFGQGAPWGALLGIYLATVIITELVTNNAAAALIFPIALSSAQQLGVDPMPFIMAIAYGASASFLTPIGYQTNTMVYSLGKYRFSDYLRGGLGLSLLYGAVVVGLTPWVFPF
jgi:di/tricarboxylate transporter